MDMIENYFFDLGGVLLDIDVQRTLDALRPLINWEGGGLQDFREDDLFGVGNNKLMQEYQDGAIGTSEFLQSFRPMVRTGVSDDMLIEAWDAMLLTISRHRLEAIRRLRSEGKGVYILSNINEEHLRWVREHFDQIGLRVGVDVTEAFFSNEMGMSKPNREIYDEAIRRSGVNPLTTVYIDDMEVNVEAGRQCGLQAHCAKGDAWLRLI